MSRRDLSRDPSRELLPVATLAALSLLPIYHRVYDAAVLTLAFAWALSALRTESASRARIVLLILCVFLIPFDVLASIYRRVPFLADLSDSWWWQALIVPHYAWGLLLVTLILLWTLTRTRWSEHVAPGNAVGAMGA
jgi:hypothetical protein